MSSKKNKIENITLGCDPEVLLKNKNTQEFIPAIGLIGGTKQKPTDISPEGKTGYCIQEDGVAFEYNIPPAKTAEEMIDSIRYVMDYVRKNKLPNTLVFDTSPSALFDEKYLKSKQATMIGCEADINAWECCENVNPGFNGNWRCAGGHIHIGYSNPNLDDNLRIIRAMDLFLGVPSILYDEDKERKKMYGKAGACRFKNFGTEYRVLSNFWIFKNQTIEWVFNNTLHAIEFINNHKDFDKFINKEKNNIIKCINEQNKQLAEELIKKHKIPALDLTNKKVNTVYGSNFTKAVLDGFMADLNNINIRPAMLDIAENIAEVEVNNNRAINDNLNPFRIQDNNQYIERDINFQEARIQEEFARAEHRMEEIRVRQRFGILEMINQLNRENI